MPECHLVSEFQDKRGSETSGGKGITGLIGSLVSSVSRR